MLAHRGEQFGLLDGVDAEVGFQVEVEVEDLGWVAGLFAHQGEHEFHDLFCQRVGLALGAASGSGVLVRVEPVPVMG